MAVTGVVLVALLGCSPLPGDSLDPVSFARGGGSEAPSVELPAVSQARAAWAGPAASATTATLPAESGFPSRLATEAGARLWVGRYRDSRGEGDVTFSLVQGGSTVSGAWKLRTGGGGPVTGVAEGSRQRFSLRMENTALDCPGTFEGWVEIGTAALVGAYHGKDCDGWVTDGRLELHPRQ